MKKGFAGFFLLLTVFLSVIPCYAGDRMISVGAAAAMQGETVLIPVCISGNPGISAFSLEVAYDQSALTLLEVLPSSNLGGRFVYKKKAVWLSGNNVRYNGEILYLRLRVNDGAASGESEVRIVYAPGEISDYEENDVDFRMSPGGILIGTEEKTVKQAMVILKRMIGVCRSFSF